MRHVLVAFFMVLPLVAQEELDPEQVKKAVEKGLAWLEAQQQADGSFVGVNGNYPMGETALGLLTLTRCFDSLERPSIQKGFERLSAYGLERTYEVGLLLMVLESRYTPTPDQLDKGSGTYATIERKNFQKLSPPGDRKLVEEGVDWLLEAQNFVWGYSQADKENWHDHSNSQYALLGISSAIRLGFRRDFSRLYRALDHLLAAQEATGPEVEWFQVPAADFSFADLNKLEKDLLKLKKKDEEHETVERIRDFTAAGEKAAMYARGWGYKSEAFPDGPGGGTPPTTGGDRGSSPRSPQDDSGPGTGPGNGPGNGPGGRGPGPGGRGPGPGPGGPPPGGPEDGPTLSMTTAGLAMLVILKSVLEEDRVYQKVYARAVDQAIRDGAAWVAHRFRVTAGHQYYYLYGLERAGVLTGCHYFGENDWYVEGGRWLLANQNADGSWTERRGGPGGMAGGGGPAGGVDFVPTCFALLFLKRGTVPVIPELPKRPVTGR